MVIYRTLGKRSLSHHTVFSLFVLFLTLLPQEIWSLTTYGREELLNIRTTSTYQHYDQEYDFPEVDPLFRPPPWTWDLIPEADPKQHGRCRRGRQSGLLVRLRSRAHHTPLPSILLANVQSLYNKGDEIRARVAFQKDIRDCNRNKQLSSKKEGGGVCLMTHGAIITTYRSLSHFVHLT